MRNFTWNRFPIKNLLIDSLLTPIVESTCSNRIYCNVAYVVGVAQARFVLTRLCQLRLINLP